MIRHLMTVIAESPWWLFLLLPALLGLLGLTAGVHADFGDCDRRYDVDERRAKLQRNYPDVPIFRSEKAALKAFPLTPPPAPPEPTPETDDNFWTREAS